MDQILTMNYGTEEMYMSENEIELAGQFDQMNKVIEELLKGSTPAAIARSLELTRVQVDNHIKNWKEFVYELRNELLIDALLANWDFYGLSGDNIIVKNNNFIF